MEQKPTIEAMAEEVAAWIAPEHVEEFVQASSFSYHHSLGTRIRNHFELWNYSYTEQIVDGIDDQRSILITSPMK